MIGQEYNVLLLGSNNSGKAALYNAFNFTLESGLNIELARNNNISIKFKYDPRYNILDSSNTINSSVSNTDLDINLILLCVDSSNEEYHKELYNNLKKISEIFSNTIEIYVVMTKIDLLENINNFVDEVEEKILRIPEKHNIKSIYLTSSNEHIGVTSLLQDICNVAVDYIYSNTNISNSRNNNQQAFPGMIDMIFELVGYGNLTNRMKYIIVMLIIIMSITLIITL